MIALQHRSDAVDLAAVQVRREPFNHRKQTQQKEWQQ
jgi:hypothetical protein